MRTCKGTHLMRLAPLIALAIAAPALTGAAVPAPSVRALTACRLSHDEAVTVVDGLKVERTIDSSKAPDVFVTRVLAKPAGLTVLDYAPTTLGATEIRNADGERLFVMAIVTAPFAEVESRVLAANGVSKCYTRVEGEPNCFVSKRQADGWQIMLFIRQHEKEVTVNCQYVRHPSDEAPRP